jgi:hypothetical protein
VKNQWLTWEIFHLLQELEPQLYEERNCMYDSMNCSTCCCFDWHYQLLNSVVVLARRRSSPFLLLDVCIYSDDSVKSNLLFNLERICDRMRYSSFSILSFIHTWNQIFTCRVKKKKNKLSLTLKFFYDLSLMTIWLEIDVRKWTKNGLFCLHNITQDMIYLNSYQRFR